MASARREKRSGARSGGSRPGPPPPLDPSAFTSLGLQPLTLGDAALFKEAFASERKRAWCYYVPYLLCYGASAKRAFLWTRVDGALTLFLARSQQSGPRLDLFFPPLPPASSAVRAATELMNERNGDRSGRVLWLEGEDADAVRGEGFEAEWKEDEYIYAPAELLDMQGQKLRTFRRHVDTFTSSNEFECEAYEARHIHECEDVLRTWKKTQGRKHRFLLDMGYTRAALRLCGELPSGDLFGEVVNVGGRVVAFAFAGQMTPELANFFVAKADPRIQGLGYFLRRRMFQRLRAYRHVNDASDLGHTGLRQFKRSLRPVEMLAVFKARQS